MSTNARRRPDPLFAQAAERDAPFTRRALLRGGAYGAAGMLFAHRLPWSLRLLPAARPPKAKA